MHSNSFNMFLAKLETLFAHQNDKLIIISK